MSEEPKLPKVGDVFIFSYAHTLNFSAKVVKITDKNVFFEYICRKEISVTIFIDNPLDSTIEWVPDPNKKYVVPNGYKDCKFSARKTSFRSNNGVVYISHNGAYAYGCPLDGKPVKEPHFC